MPTPSFVPIIGSSFDAIAGQQAGWAGFNQRQDEANLARIQAAEAAQNQWFTRLADIQQREASRRDAADALAAQTAQKARADQLASQQFASQSAEQKAEFERRQKLAEDTFNWQKTQQDTQLKKQLKVLSNFATNFAPEFQDTAKSFEDAQKQQAAAQDAVLRRKSELEAQPDFPRNSVHFDVRTHEFVPNELVRGHPMQLEGKDLVAVQAANKELAGLSADFLSSAAELKQRQAEWMDKLKQAQGYNLVPKKSKTGWELYSPDLDMTFGQMVETAKEDGADQADDSGPVWQPPEGSFAAALQGPAPQVPPSFALPTDGAPTEGTATGMAPAFGGPAGGWQPPAAAPSGGPVTKVWRVGPDGKLVLAQ